MRVLQQYVEDGIGNIPPEKIMQKFARGLTTFIDSEFQDIKTYCWNKRDFTTPTFDINDIGIVIQGPLMYDNNYTIQTAKLYRSLYPKIPIVISTWKGEATEQFRAACHQHSIVLLENEPPAVTINVNYQVKSSFQGMKFLKENTSVRYALKCRTDQRINRPDFLLYFKNLLKTFPPFGDKLLKRLIMLGNYGTCKWLPFDICDYLTFGRTQDVCMYYDIPQLPQHSPAIRKHGGLFFKIRNIAAQNALLTYMPENQTHKLLRYNLMMDRFDTMPEIYIPKQFYQKYIAPIDSTKLLETYWKFMHDYIILIDENAIVFDWPKHEEVHRYIADTTYRRMPWGASFDHARWLNLYCNFNIDWV